MKYESKQPDAITQYLYTYYYTVIILFAHAHTHTHTWYITTESDISRVVLSGLVWVTPRGFNLITSTGESRDNKTCWIIYFT